VKDVYEVIVKADPGWVGIPGAKILAIFTCIDHKTLQRNGDKKKNS
jgi:hypothetical protein